MPYRGFSTNSICDLFPMILIPFCWGRGMKPARQQVLGSVLIALIALVVLLIRAWPLLFRK